MKVRLLFWALLCLAVPSVRAQRVALKTNGLYWLTITPNLSLEARMGSHVTLDVAVEGNPGVKIGSIKPKFGAFRPMVRYYFQRPMARHYLAAGVIVADYKAEWDSREHDGISYGAGVSYGYVFTVGRHWNLEPSVGVALARYKEDRSPLDASHSAEEGVTGWRFLPMNVGFSVAYVFK